MNWSNSENRILLYFYYLIAGVSMIFILVYSKSDSFLKLYSFHNEICNSLMKGITFMGDGIFALIIAFVFLFYKIRLSIFLALNWLLSGLLVQILKRFIFPEELRPVAFFDQLGISIYKIPGIEMHVNHSFPSGHTATAFALFFGLALFIKRPVYKIALLGIASIIGFSRIYLGLHFPADILAGSVLGILTSIFLFNMISKSNKAFLDKSIQTIIKK